MPAAFVWQAALVGLAYALLRLLLPRGNPRYLAAMLARLALAIIPAWTIWHEVRLVALNHQRGFPRVGRGGLGRAGGF